MRDTWTLRFGFLAEGPTGPEYYCLITDRSTQPVDTFYGPDAHSLFMEVASLLESHATGKGLG